MKLYRFNVAALALRHSSTAPASQISGSIPLCQQNSDGRRCLCLSVSQYGPTARMLATTSLVAASHASSLPACECSSGSGLTWDELPAALTKCRYYQVLLNDESTLLSAEGSLSNCVGPVA